MYSPYEEPITQKTANVVVSDKQKKLSTTYVYDYDSFICSRAQN